MADRYAFQSPFSRGAGADPWFTVGSVAVTTTVLGTALGFLGIVLRVVEGGTGTVLSLLGLNSSAITAGELWRLITYPIPPQDDYFWALLGLLFFYLIGTQFESTIGRRAFTALLVAVVVVPAIVGTLTAVVTGQTLYPVGLSIVFLGIAAGFAAAIPQARSFFGLPFWVLVAFIYFVQVLYLLENRSVPNFAMLIATGVTGLVMTRSLGFSNVDWIPSVPLPSIVTGTGQAPQRAKRSRRQKPRRSSTSHLQAVPPSASEAEIDSLLDQVNESGIDSLTKEQKQALERHSKELRRRRDS